MIISLLNTGEQFDLPLDLKLNIEAASPIFSKEGAMSLPFNIPLTDKNRRLLDFPDRLDIYDLTDQAIRSIKERSVLVTQGSWQQVATMDISGCSEKSAEATLYFNESNIWSLLGDITLPEAMAGLHFGAIPGVGADLAIYRKNVFDAINYMFMYPNGEPETGYTDPYAELIDNREKTQDRSTTYQDWIRMWYYRGATLKYIPEGTSFRYRDFFIAPLYTKDGWLNALDPSFDAISPRFSLKETTDYLKISPFLRLDYVLHKIFEKIGKTLTIDFSSLPEWLNHDDTFREQWEAICILNNTMDALYPGCIYYSTLVPEISCKDFLNAVKAQFGCFFRELPDGIIKMEFVLPVLSNNAIKSFNTGIIQQITFNTDVEYKPSEGLEKIENPNIGSAWMDMNDPTYYHYTYQRDIFPRVFVANLDGFCQRTTTSAVGDDDTTKNTECPLSFVSIDFTFINKDYTYDHLHSDVCAYYPCARNTYIEYWSNGGVKELPYYNTEEGSLFYEMNRHYEAISKNCDIVTLQEAFTIEELINFDFSVPYIKDGRILWPSKLQYELTNIDKILATIKLVAPK